MLTPSERRGALLVAGLLLLGAAWDVWRAVRPDLRALPPAAPAADAGAGAGAAASRGSRREGAPAGADAPAGGPGPSATAPAPADGPAAPVRIDLNRAGEAELDRLPGVGPVLARRIVEHRERHGRFHRVEELRAVRGIGPRLLERLRPHLVAGP